MEWVCGRFRFDLGQRPLVMGIINASADSFSDGYGTLDACLEHAEQLVKEGADILDIGGESTRPGSDSVKMDREIERVVPLIRMLSERYDLPISIDTQKASVAEAAVAAGASIINHVSASLDLASMVPLLQKHQVGYVAMHMPDRPKVMQDQVQYRDVVAEVLSSLSAMRDGLQHAGIDPARLLFDPGIGFGKNLEHHLSLFQNLGSIAKGLSRPLLMGVSRKSWIGHLLDIPLKDQHARDAMTAVSSVLFPPEAVAVHRVHHVAWTRQALKLRASMTSIRPDLAPLSSQV